eukprot:12939056-Prorocentrum_lima.AAC.1
MRSHGPVLHILAVISSHASTLSHVEDIACQLLPGSSNRMSSRFFMDTLALWCSHESKGTT